MCKIVDDSENIFGKINGKSQLITVLFFFTKSNNSNDHMETPDLLSLVFKLAVPLPVSSTFVFDGHGFNNTCISYFTYFVLDAVITSDVICEEKH